MLMPASYLCQWKRRHDQLRFGPSHASQLCTRGRNTLSPCDAGHLKEADECSGFQVSPSVCAMFGCGAVASI